MWAKLECLREKGGPPGLSQLNGLLLPNERNYPCLTQESPKDFKKSKMSRERSFFVIFCLKTGGTIHYSGGY